MAIRRTVPRRARLLAAAGITAAAAASIGLAGVSAAAPSPSISEVQAQVDALNTKVEIAAETYDAAVGKLADARRAEASAAQKVAREQAVLTTLQTQMGVLAAAAYRSGSGGDADLLALMTSRNPRAYLDRVSTLDEIARTQSDQLSRVVAARHDLDTAKAEVGQEVAAREAVQRKLAAAKASIQADLARQQALLASLQARERAALVARLAAAERAAAAATRPPATPSIAGAPSTGGSASFATASSAPANGAAAAAVRLAYAQLGKPYQWGASGPNSYDCSGLTMAAWAAAGVSLPHNAAAQYGSITHVPSSSLRPGDLVFFGSDLHHVGIFVGDGQMIDAPHSGAVVRITGAFQSDFTGAGRP